MAQHLHILGICGTFMGGIAAIASAAGYRVTGCDANVYPPMSEQLAALGIELTEGFGEEASDRMASYYRHHGYLEAKVSSSLAVDAAKRVKLFRFDIDPVSEPGAGCAGRRRRG